MNEFEQFIKTMSPHWLREKIGEDIFEWFRVGTVARTVFDLGVAWQKYQQAKIDFERSG